MEIVIFLLCCIAAGVIAGNIKSYENSSTLMNSKITGGSPVSDESRKNHLVSVQLRKKHYCTGTIFYSHGVLSTANCALYILSYLMVKDDQNNPIVRVCYAHSLDDDSRCTSILEVAKYHTFNYRNIQDLNGNPSHEGNFGLILVGSDLCTSLSEEIEYCNFEQSLNDDIIRVIGWESKIENSPTSSQEVHYVSNHKEMKVEVMTDEDCDKHFHYPFTLAVFCKCIRVKEDAYFELQDIGSPVYIDKYVGDIIGIVSYIGFDKKTAAMTLTINLSSAYPSPFWFLMGTTTPCTHSGTPQE